MIVARHHLHDRRNGKRNLPIKSTSIIQKLSSAAVRHNDIEIQTPGCYRPALVSIGYQNNHCQFAYFEHRFLVLIKFYIRKLYFLQTDCY